MYLCYSISNSITQKKWEKVYEETLVLAQQLNLADWDRFYYKGVRSYAYCKVRERTEKEHGKEKHFWLACGDYIKMTDGEYFRLNREITEYNKNAGPAIICELESTAKTIYSNIDEQIDIRGKKIYGGAYFIRLMAILCFIESKLKEKIYIYGDINKQACEDAVKLANKFLKEPIELPARCDCNRLYEIVKNIEIPEEEKIFLMEKAYLGEIDLDYKKFIVEHFDKKIIKKFWKNRFKDNAVDSYELEKALKAYLSYGFDFKDLFSYITFTNQKKEYLKFLEMIIDIEKNDNRLSREIGLTRNPKNNQVRGFTISFRRALFGPKDSNKLTHDTFDDYVNELSKYFGNYIDVRSFLKEKIPDEDDDSIFLRVKNYLAKDEYYLFKGEEKYDIIFSFDLMTYKPGDKIAPYLIKEIKAVVKKNIKRLSDKEFTEIEQKETTEQIYELIDLSRQFPVRDIDWFHAIDYFNSHSDALKRYYPLFRMKFELFSSDEYIAKALFINDKFYEFCKEIK